MDLDAVDADLCNSLLPQFLPLNSPTYISFASAEDHNCPFTVILVPETKGFQCVL